MDEPKRTKADSGAVVTEEQAAEFAAKAAAEGRPRLRILTGDRTTGKLHIGHYVGSLKHRVKYQSLYDTFILMADVQALTTHYDRPEILKQSVREVALDYMASGLDPYTGGLDDGSKPKIVVQSMVPAIAELTVYYGLLVPVGSLVNNPTVKVEAEQQGFSLEENDNYLDSFALDYRSRAEQLASEIQSQLSNDHPPISSAPKATLLRTIAGLQKVNDKVIKDEFTYQLASYEEFLENTADPPDFFEPDNRIIPLPDHRLVVEREIDRIVRAWGAVKGSKMLERHVVEVTLSSQRQRGFSSLTYGFLGYPVSQAADITFVGAHLVPVGPDQVPLIELCREVVHRFNSQYGKRKRILTTPNALLGVREALQGIDGNAKMSKSLNNAIYLAETDAEIWAKVKPAPTDPQRVRRDDPGRPEMCNIFSYHKVFNGEKEPAIDEQALGVASVEEVAENCRGAKWGCIQCKENLCKKLTAILDPMRERRADWEKRPDDLEDVLRAGTARANEEGQKTLEKVRSAMHMDYFASSVNQT